MDLKKISTIFFWVVLGVIVLSAMRGDHSPSKVVPNNTQPVAQPLIKIFINPPTTNKPEDEYITITSSLSNKHTYFVSGWRLRSASGREVLIEKASNLPLLAQINTEQPILIGPKSKIIINSGRSPIGTDYRINSCSGFLNEHFRVIPPIEEKCPLAEDLILPKEEELLEPDCISYIESIPRCHDPVMDEELKKLSSFCRETLAAKINYNACTARFSSSEDFYKNEWRIYLNKDKTFWKKAVDVISLFDQSGQILSTFSY